jgi:hypothetical protein
MTSSLRPPKKRLATAAAAVVIVSAVPMITRKANAVQAKPTVVLDVRRNGGFAPAFTDFRAVPEHLVTTTMHYLPGPSSESFPGPMLVPVLTSPVSASTVKKIDALAKTAGLTRTKNDWGQPPTADVPNLDVTYRGRQQSIASWGVGEEALTPAQRSARKKVAALLAALPTKAATPFKPTSVVLAVRLAEAEVIPSGLPAPEVKDWPAAAEDISSSGGCMIITSKSGIAALQAVDGGTQFRKNAKTWQVFARPMLPGDRGCGSQV